MDIVVKGRRAEVTEKFRQHAIDKLSKIERLNHRIIRLDVEVSEERNPRQNGQKERVELTCVSKGPVIRAEAAAPDPYAALDLALGKLESRLRRLADKRRVHHGQRTPESLANATAVNGQRAETTHTPEAAATEAVDEGDEPEDQSRIVVREKIHEAEPMSLDDAMLRMELVGHDFFLFADRDTGHPSVVYRRKGYAYGVIRLKQ
jgi:ribosomal subunit interface protein